MTPEPRNSRAVGCLRTLDPTAGCWGPKSPNPNLAVDDIGGLFPPLYVTGSSQQHQMASQHWQGESRGNKLQTQVCFLSLQAEKSLPLPRGTTSRPGLGGSFHHPLVVLAGFSRSPEAPDKSNRLKQPTKPLESKWSLKPQPTKVIQDLCAKSKQGDY